MKRTILAIAILAAGCGGSSGNGTGGNGSAGGSGSAAIAVIDSDYKSTAVSLVDSGKAALFKDDCIDSGAVSSTLSMALSSDVVLASSKQANGELLLIDRANSALDYIAGSAGGCTVLRLMSMGSFYANPHDVVSLSATKSYVLLNEPNTMGGAAATNDQGDDILIIDPTAQTITGHIDLSTYADSAAVLPRPDRALLVNGLVYVTLDENSEDFKTNSEGRIVIIDPTTDTVTGKIDLTGYVSCAGLDYWAASKTLAVGCSGDYNATLDVELAQSAIVLIDVSGATPSIKKAIPASALGSRPISGQNFAFAGDSLMVASTYGSYSDPTLVDKLWAITIDAGTAVKLADGDANGVFTAVVYLPATKQLLATDGSATAPGVRVFDVSKPAAVTQTTIFDANPKSGLPPRQIGWY